MKRTLAAAVLATLFASPAMADVVTPDLLDPLHGYCAGAGQCVDNGTNSPTSTNPPSKFGFTVSPGPASGDLVIDILIPNNETVGVTPFGITGTLSGTASLFPTASPWTSGGLDAYLGISASPANPIGAYLPSTVARDPGANGFFVYQANLGNTTLQGASNPNLSPLFNLNEDLQMGSYIVAFLNEGTSANPDWIATANSGAIFETDAPPPPSVPEPNTLILLASALLGLWLCVNRRRFCDPAR